MSQTEHVGAPCPSCSPDEGVAHEVLATGGGQATVRCTDCGHVHKEPIPQQATVKREVIVSQDNESLAVTVPVPAEETIRVGEEFVVDTEEALLAVRVTSVEVGPERRVEAATGREVKTIWTRAVDNVYVNVTVHPADGSRDRTRSLKVGVPGDHEFTVGEAEELGGEPFVVEGILVRDDAHGYPPAKLDHAGDAVAAKDIKRVYAREEAVDAWSAW